MVDNALEWAGVTDVKRALDVGCGIGGGSRHLSRKFGCAATGVTLSPVQAARANEITADAADVDESLVRVQVADALHTPFEDAAFDLVYSMESGEHMPDKEAFVNELARVCAPGGQILIVTWCHRVLDASEKSSRRTRGRCSIASARRTTSRRGARSRRTRSTSRARAWWTFGRRTGAARCRRFGAR
jgi:tocopherol O-methyltransferase